MSNFSAFSPEDKPIQFVFRVSAPLVNSEYTWVSTNKVRSYPSVDIQRDFTYFFYAFNFSVDVSELDYQAAIVINDQIAAGNERDANTLPTFSLYFEGGKSPILRQPLGLPSFYENIPYRNFYNPRTTNGGGSNATGVKNLTGEQVNNLNGSFTATLDQTPALIGKQNINMILTLFAQEITSDKQSLKFQSGRRN